jgi:hypothetical protein
MDYDIKYKAALYAIPLFLTPFADKIIPILFEDKWPSIPMTAGCSLLGIMASSLGLRMYFDGSYERSKNGAGPGPENPSVLLRVQPALPKVTPVVPAAVPKVPPIKPS